MFCGPLEHQTTIAQWPKMADSRDSVRWRIPGLFRPGAIPETGVPLAHPRDYSGTIPELFRGLFRKQGSRRPTPETIPGLFRGYSGGYSGNKGPPACLLCSTQVGNLIASPE